MNPASDLRPLASLEVLFTPADFGTLAQRDLRTTTCVVFDILRATSTMIAALASGASGIIPVASIAEAVKTRARDPRILLGGERHGLRIRAEMAGGADFDLGNSPREFTPDRVRGRTIAVTTTNGTRALRASASAGTVLVGGFMNLRATAEWIAKQPPAQLILVCSGTGEGPALEDVLAAGALCERLAALINEPDLDDSAFMARELHRVSEHNLLAAVSGSRNARRLLAIPELRDDVAFCLEKDRFDFVAAMGGDGVVRRKE